MCILDAQKDPHHEESDIMDKIDKRFWERPIDEIAIDLFNRGITEYETIEKFVIENNGNIDIKHLFRIIQALVLLPPSDPGGGDGIGI